MPSSQLNVRDGSKLIPKRKRDGIRWGLERLKDYAEIIPNQSERFKET